MVGELAEKEQLKQAMIRAEHLASLGRLSAGIAHEINNPLGGLLTAVDTLKQHASPEPVTRRLLPLLERGLEQIREIVSALLVEARSKDRPLNAQDIDDVRILLANDVNKSNVILDWENGVAGELNLPSTLVRQALLNLTLNAVQAAGKRGRVRTRVRSADGRLDIEVTNGGDGIPPEVMEHLFEPFRSAREGGRGLGLWVTYQIVQQLRGEIEAESRNGLTRFHVTLPLGGWM
jgi:signal transduction histidine kinase